MNANKSAYTNLVYALAAIFLVLGFMGYLDIKNYTYDGYNSNDFTVTKVDENSPASEAGMQVGDQILTIDGKDVRDADTWNNRPRTKVGDTRALGVSRDGVEMTYDITYASMPKNDDLLNRVGWLIGLIFLIMGVWAIMKKKSQAALYFALFGIGFGQSFMGRPYLESEAMRDIMGSVSLSLVLLAFAFLVGAILYHSPKSSFTNKSNATKILFVPAILLAVFFIILTIMDPDSTSGLNTFVDYLVMFFILFYFGWAILAIVKKYKQADEETRNNNKLGLMFWAVIIGLVPILIDVVVNTLMPTVSLPGSDYYFITMALIPIGFGLAIAQSRAAASE
ncbi:MAG: PDZ domain-containing protein [Saprospiraceae bacterium]|nr:PDZ domain-containing protein [Saprospiraceae bacterium]